MPSYRALVVDDEPLARRRIARLLRECGCEVVGEYKNVPTLLEALEGGMSPDVLFLDIEMPGGTGLEAQAELPPTLPVVFVTAHPQHAARAYDVDAVDYLLKPVYKDRVLKALEKLNRHPARTAAPAPSAAPSATASAAAPSRFPGRASGGTFFLEFRKVSHFEFEDDAVWAWLGGQRFRTTWDSLGEVETAFPQARMLRVQRHLLVRPEAIVGLRSLPGGRAAIRLSEFGELEVSRSMTPRVREVLGIGKGV